METLHRSKRNKVILGVCGGLAEYFQTDPILLRIICVVITILGPGLIVYLIAALLMPEDKRFDDQWKGSPGTNTGTYAGEGTGGAGAGSGSSFENEFNSNADEWNRPAKYNSGKTKLILGAILVGAGVLILGRQIIPALFNLKYTVPLLLIGIGGIIVFRGRK